MGLLDFINEMDINENERRQTRKEIELDKIKSELSRMDETYWTMLAKKAGMISKRFEEEKTLIANYFLWEIEYQIDLANLKYEAYKKMIRENKIDKDALDKIKREEKMVADAIEFLKELVWGKQGQLG